MKRLILSVALALVVVTSAQAQSFGQFKTGGADPFAGTNAATLTFDATTNVNDCLVIWINLSQINRTVSTIVSGTNTLTQIATGENASQEKFIWGGVITDAETAFAVTLSGAAGSGSTQLYGMTFTDANTTDCIGNSAIATAALMAHDSGSVSVTGSSAAFAGDVYGTSGTYTIDADYTSNNNTAQGLAGRRVGVSGSDNFQNTSAANETALTSLVEILPAAAGATCSGGLTLLGAGKCE